MRSKPRARMTTHVSNFHVHTDSSYRDRATVMGGTGHYRYVRRAGGPSAGAQYPLQLFIAVTDVIGLGTCLYSYVPAEHALITEYAVNLRQPPWSPTGADDMSEPLPPTSAAMPTGST